MAELVSLYLFPLGGVVFGGGALALVGAQLAARDQSVQTLVTSQAASLGVVLGLALDAWLGRSHSHPHEISLLPLSTGLIVAALAFVGCARAIPSHWPSHNSYFIGLMAVLMALSHMVMSTVPSLESHIAHSFFGDASLASNFEAGVVAGLGVLITALLLSVWYKVTANSFEHATFSGQFLPFRPVEPLFLITALVMVVASVQFLGLLFTLACLFIPALVLKHSQSSLRNLAIKLVFSACVGSALGFLFSLEQGRLPTVACITLGLVLIGGGVAAVGRLLARGR